MKARAKYAIEYLTEDDLFVNISIQSTINITLRKFSIQAFTPSCYIFAQVCDNLSHGWQKPGLVPSAATDKLAGSSRPGLNFACKPGTIFPLFATIA